MNRVNKHTQTHKYSMIIDLVVVMGYDGCGCYSDLTSHLPPISSVPDTLVHNYTHKYADVP